MPYVIKRTQVMHKDGTVDPIYYYKGLVSITVTGVTQNINDATHYRYKYEAESVRKQLGKNYIIVKV